MLVCKKGLNDKENSNWVDSKCDESYDKDDIRSYTMNSVHTYTGHDEVRRKNIEQAIIQKISIWNINANIETTKLPFVS